jgi:hypothetical protein
MVDTYWGAKKVLIESGRFTIDKESPDHEFIFPTKAAMNRGIDSLLDEGLENQEVAMYLHDTFGVEQVLRREGVGEKEANEILDSVNPAQYGTRVLVEYINRFGHFQGINKYNETFNLVYILRDIDQAIFHEEQIDLGMIEAISWNKEVNQNNEDDEF